jgi:hypothetical protein
VTREVLVKRAKHIKDVAGIQCAFAEKEAHHHSSGKSSGDSSDASGFLTDESQSHRRSGFIKDESRTKSDAHGGSGGAFFKDESQQSNKNKTNFIVRIIKLHQDNINNNYYNIAVTK